MRILAGRPIAVRLALSSLFWSSLVLLVAGIILSTLYRQATERSFDERLLVYANDVAADLVTPSDEKREFGGIGDPRFEIPLSGWYWQSGRIEAAARDITSSRSLVGNTLPTLVPSGPERPFGGIRKGSVTGPEDRLLRMLERDIDLGEDGRYVVRIAAPADEISSAILSFIGSLVITFVLLGMGLGVSTLLQIRFGLRPLIDLRAAVADVRRGEAERILGSYPGDVAPLAEELNLLLEANREILERARTQVGNLAHALKTPLSVIVNEAGSRGDEPAERIREQASVMRDQVEYYLRRARTAALAGTSRTITDIRPILDGLGRTFDKIYGERAIRLRIQPGGVARFRGERQDFEEMAGNLIDNACKWAEGRVEVAIDAVADGEARMVRLCVDDDGPGMPQAARAEAIKRGRRLDETRPGSGLGLSIVSDLAAHYGGRLTLAASGLGGTRAELILPGEAAS